MPARLRALAADAEFGEILTKGSLALVLRLVGLAISYLFTVLVARLSGADAWGVFALCLAAINLAVIVGKLGLDTACVRLVSEHLARAEQGAVRAILRRAIGLLLPASLAMSLLLWWLAPAIATALFDKPQLAGYFRASAFAIVPLAVLTFAAETLRGFKMIASYAFFQNVAKFLGASLALIAVYMFWQVDRLAAPVFAFIAGVTASAALAAALLMWRVRGMGSDAESPLRTPQLLRIAAPLMLSNSVLFLMAWTDTLILGAYRPEWEVGAYHVATRLAALTAFTITAVNSIAAPQFAALHYAGEHERFARVVRRATRLIAYATLPVVVLLIGLRRPLLAVFGPEFVIASAALVMLVLGQLVSAVSGSVGYILQMTGRGTALQNILLVSLVLKIGLSLALVPRFGMNGAAFASMIGLAGWNVACVIYIRAHYGLTTLFIPLLSRFRRR